MREYGEIEKALFNRRKRKRGDERRRRGRLLNRYRINLEFFFLIVGHPFTTRRNLRIRIGEEGERLFKSTRILHRIPDRNQVSNYHLYDNQI